MKREYLRKIIKEEVDNFKKRKKENIKESVSLSSFSDINFDFD